MKNGAQTPVLQSTNHGYFIAQMHLAAVARNHIDAEAGLMGERERGQWLLLRVFSAAVQIHRGHHAAHARLEKLEFDGADADNAPAVFFISFAAVYHQVGAEAAHFHRLFKLAVEQGERALLVSR